MIQIFFLISQALATVDMQDGSFIQDAPIFDNTTITYNSRSIYNGIFGFGWCSPFEAHIEKQDKLYLLKVCDQEQHLKANQKENLTIMQTKEKTWSFDKNNKLTEYRENKKIYKIEYKQGQISKIKFKNQSYTFEYNLNNFVSQISSSNHTSTFYYTLGTLKYIINKDFKLEFKYNKLRNLHQIKNNENLISEIYYNDEQDTVGFIINSNKCFEKYQFKTATTNQLSSEVKSYCNKKLINHKKFTFKFTIKNDELDLLDQKTSSILQGDI